MKGGLHRLERDERHQCRPFPLLNPSCTMRVRILRQHKASPSVTFVSMTSLKEGIGERFRKKAVAVRNCREIGKRDMVHNSATPKIDVDPETYEVRADGVLLTCEPAAVLPLAQRYFLF